MHDTAWRRQLMRCMTRRGRSWDEMHDTTMAERRNERERFQKAVCVVLVDGSVGMKPAVGWVSARGS